MTPTDNPDNPDSPDNTDNPDFTLGSIDRPTPCLVVDEVALDHNLATMTATLPGDRLRPHVKAFKCTSLARRLVARGHRNFTCATLSEVTGMLNAGLGHDLLLANETVDVAALDRVETLRQVAAVDGADTGSAQVTIAVDSDETLAAAIKGGVRQVLIDVNVGLPRCGCDVADAGRLADAARAAGIEVRGVMGYEGHLMMIEDRGKRVHLVDRSMAILAEAADAVGGSIISAGGSGTFDTNTVATEIQAGSFTLMDTQYSTIDIPFRQALYVEATIISVNRAGGWLVADSGLKSLGMDHGDPSWSQGDVLFCSDEHITLSAQDPDRWSVGDRIRLAPAHVDPTVAKHERMWLVGAAADGDSEGPRDGAGAGHDATRIEEWPVDLRHW